MKSLCGSRTGANKANQVGVTPLRTDVLQRLEDMMATCVHLEEFVLLLVGHDVAVPVPADCAIWIAPMAIIPYFPSQTMCTCSAI